MLRSTLIALLVLLPAVVLADDLPESMEPVKVSIAVPVHHGHRSLNKGDHFHILVTNVSAKPIRLWTDRFSWGYDNLSFELIGDDGKVTRIVKKARWYTRNFPDWLELEAGGSYVLNVDWFSEQGRGIWDNAPAADGKRKPMLVKLRAVYEAMPEDESRKIGVWTGKIVSPVQVCAIW